MKCVFYRCWGWTIWYCTAWSVGGVCLTHSCPGRQAGRQRDRWIAAKYDEYSCYWHRRRCNFPLIKITECSVRRSSEVDLLSHKYGSYPSMPNGVNWCFCLELQIWRGAGRGYACDRRGPWHIFFSKNLRGGGWFIGLT